MSYAWDFGDGTGTTGNVVSPGHAYAKPGYYDVTLTVTDDQGATDSAAISVFIHSVRPTPAFTVSGTHNAQEKQFDASRSSDSDGTIVEYRWDFGDGTSGLGVSPVHRFASVGTYTVTLTVVDDAGESDSSSGSVAIDLSPPRVRLGVSWSACTGTDIPLAATASDRDGHVVDYRWDLDGSGEFARDTHDSSQTTTTFTAAGVHGIGVQVTDDSGLTARSFQRVSVRDCTSSARPPHSSPRPSAPTTSAPASPTAPSNPRLDAPAHMTLRSRSLIVNVRCGTACSIVAQLRAASHPLGHAERMLSTAGTARFKVWLNRDTWRLLRDRRHLLLVVKVTQQGSPVVTIRKRIKLLH